MPSASNIPSNVSGRQGSAPHPAGFQRLYVKTAYVMAVQQMMQRTLLGQ